MMRRRYRSHQEQGREMRKSSRNCQQVLEKDTLGYLKSLFFKGFFIFLYFLLGIYLNIFETSFYFAQFEIIFLLKNRILESKPKLIA